MVCYCNVRKVNDAWFNRRGCNLLVVSLLDVV